MIEQMLETTCKNMIKTILFCLEHATKGTIYRIGPMPELRAVRITSGIRREGSDEIQWGLPAQSDYNPPGKDWKQYRDFPDRVLEAMGWCVEKQKSWTAENPYEDVRSVGKQLRGEIEDYYHMEPVLVPKADLYGSCPQGLEYPLDWRGHPIWQDTPFVVSAVIKIHFLPHSIRQEDRSTRIIRELSRSLGTELLSLQLKETLLREQKDFTRKRLQSCTVLAHELRNTLTKLGFVFSAANAQIAILREAWEEELRRAYPRLDWKGNILARLNELIRLRLPSLNGADSGHMRTCLMLIEEQEALGSLALHPNQGEQWLKHKIRPGWERLFEGSAVWNDCRDEARSLIDRLESALSMGMDEGLIAGVGHLPLDLCERWSRLAYVHLTPERIDVLEEIMALLDQPALPVASRQQVKKTLKSLKVLVELIPEVEKKANGMILSLRQGDSCDFIFPEYGEAVLDGQDFPRESLAMR
ncbi:MAG: hypothetical protein ACLGPL_02760 [Acidobacteriota bacterium]